MDTSNFNLFDENYQLWEEITDLDSICQTTSQHIEIVGIKAKQGEYKSKDQILDEYKAIIERFNQRVEDHNKVRF